ncbi:CoB--CoM heterodisulfide reductase iron-sulfur subunit A family protein [Desulforamulus ruminis]|uniref:FAD dependent oxidoreductase n=1 Tax=Desulforamulus ruminis (strain ATCC 23193 / DSM 2154 / NCIMB 8452 / DL) TaxID=696281 RepID=F6DR88_DESRL|nr:CoB--CoM heterodisulfide reductase iron-sulfur subunit A family protein [Desulforamulus ruminis]AEG60923.1 FAD dependent oxidoreductase [Desulforamulus ruminis DSM 2154]
MTDKNKIGAVLVVGGGISGMQSALDLAESGYRVYLVEKKPAIGGTMARLDKTFPTNDCAMCTMSPKLVDVGRHLNIEIITGAELVGLDGEPGNFKATVAQQARCVSLEKCIGCGACAEECPVKVNDDFDGGLGKRKAIYKLYAQATPNAYAIDKSKCLKIKNPKACGKCLKACPAGAIDHSMPDTRLELAVGAVILSPGFEPMDGELRGEFGWGIYANVLTSLQFERLLSASGPTMGHLVRPSDHVEPKKVGFIQCVGSRDSAKGNPYCSAVCCMYATKHAIIAQEHEEGLETKIFYMDVRAYGKDFEKYYDRARIQHGVKYEKAMVSSIKEDPNTKNLIVRYRTPDGKFAEEEFDMMVLSVGLKPSSGNAQLAKACGIELDPYGFCKTLEFAPGQSTREGVFASGAFCAPKDIPETVVDASAAAANAAQLLSDVRGTLSQIKEYPPERDVTQEDPRIGVFVCNCGINIGSVVRVPEVAEFAKTLPGVVHTEEFLFSCSQDSIEKIKERIQEHQLNRVVVASCTPRTHAPLFMSSLKESGLNPYLFEQANIREHSSWVHRNYPEAATEKAKDLVKMAVAKVRLLKPVYTSFMDINRQALVIGGGVAGMTNALNLANQGFKVILVERTDKLGGNALEIQYTMKGNRPLELVESLIRDVQNHSNIDLNLNSNIKEVAGYLGNYKTTLSTPGGDKEVSHGVVIIATGAELATTGEYLYGQHEAVLTQRELEQKLAGPGIGSARNIVMIQCVGSRDSERPYCSRICCYSAVKNALKIKEQNPEANVFVLYRDIRTYGFYETYYAEARKKGVVFVRYTLEEKPQVEALGDQLKVSIKDPILNRKLELETDLLILSTGLIPAQGTDGLSQIFKVSLNADNFYLEAHMKLRPVDFAADGLYLCGLAHSPKLIEESIAQANAAAVRAVTMLSKDKLESLGNVAQVNPKWCKGCGLCIEACSYGARTMNEITNVAEVLDVLCQGCGACVAACPSGACQQKGFEKQQIVAMLDACNG